MVPGPIQHEGTHETDHRRRRCTQIKPHRGCDQHSRRQAGRPDHPDNVARYGDPERWAQAPGPVKAFGIEGTGSYGAGLSRVLQAKGHTVIEVMRPNRQLRHLHGKSDNPDAEGAARSG